MNNSTQHISFKFITLILVITLLLPSAVKINHVFEDHKHEVCKNNSVEHFHELEIDCEFYKFNTTNHFILSDFQQSNIVVAIKSVLNYSYYKFLNNHQQFNISLRGPPQVLV